MNPQIRAPMSWTNKYLDCSDCDTNFIISNLPPDPNKVKAPNPKLDLIIKEIIDKVEVLEFEDQNEVIKQVKARLIKNRQAAIEFYQKKLDTLEDLLRCSTCIPLINKKI